MPGKVIDLSQLTGGGGGSGTGWDGQVEFRGDLPITVGTPAVGSIYLVEKPTTILLVAYTTYQSGLYFRDLNNGNLNDWRRLNIKIKFTDGEFKVVGVADESKVLQFDVSSIATSTTRTASWQNSSGIVAWLSDIITNHSGLALDDGTNPHGTTKSDVGLGNVPNVDATLRPNHTGAENLENKFARSGIITIAINGNLNDWNPTGLSSASVIRINPSASYTITGLQGGEDGRLIIIHNISTTNAARFFPESASSAAENRFANGITIGPNASFGMQYDPTTERWRVLYATSDGAQLYSHEYGEFYFQDNTVETLLVLNTPVKIGGATYSDGDSSVAMQVATGRITYTGLENIQVACHATVTANNIDGGSPDYVFYIAKNGLIIGKSASERDIGRAEASIGFQCLTDMSQNDYIECWVENVTDNDDIVVQDLNCFIHTV